MPRAFTIEEKKERALEHIAAKAIPEVVPAADGATRRKRGVFNGTQGKLRVDGKIDGYHLHILNDDGTRITDAIDNGYEFVKPSEIEGVSENVVSKNGDLGDSRIRFLVGLNKEGQPMYAYLMKIRQEWYDEDQADQQSKNDKIDAAIRAGKTAVGDAPGFYRPDGGIKLS
jgi:hypothetical protein